MNRYLAEIIGTFLIVYVVLTTSKTIPVVLVLVLTVLLFTHVSGASFNPLTTLAKYFRGDIFSKEMIGYISSQSFGAFLAYYIAKNK